MFLKHEHDILPIVKCRMLSKYLSFQKITVRENPIAKAIHEVPNLIACKKLIRPKKTQTASHPKNNDFW